MLRIEIDGRTPEADLLGAALLNHYGHFTAMQVRGGRVRGLDLHLTRLSAATAELFGADLATDLVRRNVRHALTDKYADGDVRVQVLRLDPAADPAIVVIVRPPVDMDPAPQRLRSVRYQRPLAHIKQVGGSFGQIYHGRAATNDGYDDALLTADGTISETTIANIGFFDGAAVTWPDAPALDGVTKQLLERHGPGAGVPSRSGPVTLDDVTTYRAAFVANSQGVAPVSAVDDKPLAMDEDFMAMLYRVYESAPWDTI